MMLLLPVLAGCLSHTRKLQHPRMAGPVVNADAMQLVRGINQRYDEMSSLTATVDFTASVGGARLGKRTVYTPCLGYILIRKPQMLRLLVLVPVLHTHAIDMASDGTTFTLLIPPQNRAFEGRIPITTPSANPLENLRPNVFLEAILIHSISPKQIVSVTDESTVHLNPRTHQLIELPEYDLTVLSETHPSSHLARVAKPLRIIRISRLNLLPIEQDIYNAGGGLETQVLYGPYHDFAGTQFPSTIDIHRPLDDYRVRLAVDKLKVNQPLTDDQFELRIPKDMHVRKLK